MTTRERHAVLLSLVEALHKNGSGCRLFHIQKCAYFLQELLSVPLDLNLIFYNQGPYSFELDEEVTAMEADHLVTRQYRGELDGASYQLGKHAVLIMSQYQKTIVRYQGVIEFVAQRLGQKSGIELERLATAQYLRKSHPAFRRDEWPSDLLRLKPNMSFSETLDILDTVESMHAELVATS